MCDETLRKSGEGGEKGGVYSNWGTGQGGDLTRERPSGSRGADKVGTS